MSEILKIAIQKSGRLNEESIQLLKECGVTISKNPSVMGETVKTVLNNL